MAEQQRQTLAEIQQRIDGVERHAKSLRIARRIIRDERVLEISAAVTAIERAGKHLHAARVLGFCNSDTAEQMADTRLAQMAAGIYHLLETA